MINYGQKRHSQTTETTMTSLAGFLASIAGDDLLLEIFTRLPNSRTVCHCTAVCRRWRSVISHPQFVSMFKRHHQKRQQSPPPFTLLLRDGYVKRIPFPPTLNQLSFGEFFSEESKKLHGPNRSSCKAKYLDFLPQDSVVRASCNDLLLVELAAAKRLCVCNPLTHQWAMLPKPPVFDSHAYALACDPSCTERSYRVTLIITSPWRTIRVAVFRSEAGRWDESVRTFSLDGALPRLPMAVGTSDGVIYAPLVASHGWFFTKIAAFDPFDANPTGLSCREVGLPDSLRRGWRGSPRRTRIGVVRGQLRLWQSYLDKRMSKFVFRAYGLDKKYDNWVSLHDFEFEAGDGSKFTAASAVVALHPDDDDVFFFKYDGPQIWQYRIGTGRGEDIIGEIDKLVRTTEVVYTVVHQSWPTSIPQLH